MSAQLHAFQCLTAPKVVLNVKAFTGFDVHKLTTVVHILVPVAQMCILLVLSRRTLSEKFIQVHIYNPIATRELREGGNYSDTLPLKAARRDSISNLTSFEASNLSCTQIQCCFIKSCCGAPR